MIGGSEESLKSPAPLPWLDGVALLDLVLHETHAACVDARGDVYQWGKVSTQGSIATEPIRTLRGKVIVWTFCCGDDKGSLIVIHPEHQTVGNQRGQSRGFVPEGRRICAVCHECPAGILKQFQILGRRG